MSAGICGKRVGFEEIFGSSSPTSYSSAKKSRWGNYGSPTRSDFGFGHEDSVSALIRMFPGVDAEWAETVLRNHNHKIEDAIDFLQMRSSDDFNARDKSQNFDSATTGNCSIVPDGNTDTCCHISQKRDEKVEDVNSSIAQGNIIHGSKWVDMFVQEMTNAIDFDDARIRAARILEAFEHNITADSRQSEELKLVSLKEHLQSLVNDNQILKRAVAIQHERNMEQEEKTREIQQLKHILCQYQDQVQTLEVRNYTLNLHLQRAQSVPGHGQFRQDRF